MGERITDKQVIETFKCATGSGWGILIDGYMDCDVPYFRTEAEALAWIELLSGLK